MHSVFLMTREIAHQKSFETALYAIEENFPSAILPGVPEYTNVYMNMSQDDEGSLDVEGRGILAHCGRLSATVTNNARWMVVTGRHRSSLARVIRNSLDK